MFRETIRLIPPDILHPPCRSHSAFTHNLSLPHCGQYAALIMCSLSSCGRVDRASILSVDSGHCRRCPSSRPEVVSLLPFHQPYEIYSRYSHMFVPLAPLLSFHLNLTLRLIFRCVSCALVSLMFFLPLSRCLLELTRPLLVPRLVGLLPGPIRPPRMMVLVPKFLGTWPL